MGMMTSLQAAEKWKISKRQVNFLCAHGRIPGARFENKRWMIPEDFDYTEVPRLRSEAGQIMIILRLPPAQY